ncbi:hypothetical protein KKD52_08810 [Myxococcota bacterium]|jgi:hypothetical protein|nr:hypothetical protein [Myxococcota bacterium]MBU1244181.1 hypothetical protein [Myxococcota bacterium]MBU1413862.1 hypothetical protein [Myxococcota bacterium]MBU1510447.1 hypothetical protein [Myxococcota bacterium]PKN27598.1 MAG: hypothetical protein CVU65_01985 [Deltaproteobacteria bacterium HGW-Deltaproteobacteria-22]
MTEQVIYIDEFKQYITRFQTDVGNREFGEYGSWNGFVVKKMNFDEFVAKYEEFRNLERLYADILERGDTVNDAIFRTLREQGANLLIEV